MTRARRAVSPHWQAASLESAKADETRREDARAREREEAEAAAAAAAKADCAAVAAAAKADCASPADVWSEASARCGVIHVELRHRINGKRKRFSFGGDNPALSFPVRTHYFGDCALFAAYPRPESTGCLASACEYA